MCGKLCSDFEIIMIDLVAKSVIKSSIGFEITVRNTSPSRLLDLVSKICYDFCGLLLISRMCWYNKS